MVVTKTQPAGDALTDRAEAFTDALQVRDSWSIQVEERLNKLNQTVDVTDADVDSQPKDAAAEVTKGLDTASGSPVTPTPLWPPGRRPFGPERGKTPPRPTATRKLAQGSRRLSASRNEGDRERLRLLMCSPTGPRSETLSRETNPQLSRLLGDSSERRD